MSTYLEYIGCKNLLRRKSNIKSESAVTREIFKPADEIKVAVRYLEYLKELDHYQKDRRTTIENKNSQLVGQASLVASIFSLFVSLLINSFSGVSLFITGPLTFIFLVVLIHYLLTILHAINTLKINRYSYSARSTSTITKETRAETELEFVNAEISDLVYIINHTYPIDNKKGENLIFATRCFEIANFGFAFLSLIIILSIFSIKKTTPEINVKNLKEINLTIPDTVNNRIISLPKIDLIEKKSHPGKN
jgi:hypothetical protein